MGPRAQQHGTAVPVPWPRTHVYVALRLRVEFRFPRHSAKVVDQNVLLGKYTRGRVVGTETTRKPLAVVQRHSIGSLVSVLLVKYEFGPPEFVIGQMQFGNISIIRGVPVYTTVWPFLTDNRVI